MKLLEVLLFIYVADVYAQLISNQQTSPGFIQTQYRNKTHHSIPSATTGGKIRGSVTTGRNTRRFNINRDENRGQREVNVKGDGRANQSTKVFTNVSQDLHGNNVKYIQRLNSGSEPDKIIFYDDVNYDRKPFTNERKPEDKFTYSSGPSRDPSATPYRETLISPVKQQNSSRGILINRNNVSHNGPTESTLYDNRNEGATTEEFELDNRVAFTDGDTCPTGLVKVKGKCVEKV